MKVFGYIKLLLSAGLTVLVILSSSAARSEREALSYDDFIAQYGTQRSESDDEFLERREALVAKASTRAPRIGSLKGRRLSSGTL